MSTTNWIHYGYLVEVSLCVSQRRVSLSALQSKASKVSAKNREEQEDGERKVKKGSKRDKKDLVLANNGLVDGYMDDDTYVRTKDIYDMEMVKKENQDNQDALEIKVEVRTLNFYLTSLQCDEAVIILRHIWLWNLKTESNKKQHSISL